MIDDEDEIAVYDRKRLPWPLVTAMWVCCWFACFMAVAALAHGLLPIAVGAAILAWGGARVISEIEREYR